MAAPRAKPPSKPVQARTVVGRQIMPPCDYGMNRSIFIILNRNILSSTFFSAENIMDIIHISLMMPGPLAVKTSTTSGCLMPFIPDSGS